jgi:hypothetical protein
LGWPKTDVSNADSSGAFLGWPKIDISNVDL